MARAVRNVIDGVPPHVSDPNLDLDACARELTTLFDLATRNPETAAVDASAAIDAAGSTRDERVDDKVALVTGGAGGIGAAVARRLATSGARVVIVDVGTAGGDAGAAGIDGFFVRTDVSRIEHNHAAVAAWATTRRP